MAPTSHLVGSHFMLHTFSLQTPLGKNNRIPQLWAILSLASVGSSKSLQSGHCLHVNHIRPAGWESSSERGPWNHLVLDSNPGSATSNLHEFDQGASSLCIRFLVRNTAGITYLLERSAMSLKSPQYGLQHISSRWKHHRCLWFYNYCSWIGEANLTSCFSGKKKCFLDEGWSQISR